jgi:hypothetical protein
MLWNIPTEKKSNGFGRERTRDQEVSCMYVAYDTSKMTVSSLTLILEVHNT